MDYTDLPDYVVYILLIQVYVLATQLLLIRYNYANTTIKHEWSLLMLAIAAGIYEEVIFRYDLVNLCNEFNIPNVALFTSITFGILHAFNISIVGGSSTMSFLLISNQVIFTTALGYILYNIQNLKICMMIHVWFNVTNYLVITYWGLWYHNVTKKVDNHIYKHIKNISSTTDNILEYVPLFTNENCVNRIKVHKTIKYMWEYNLDYGLDQFKHSLSMINKDA